MPVRFVKAPLSSVLAGAVLLIGHATAHADLGADTRCSAINATIDGPGTSTTSSCQLQQAEPSADIPGLLHEGGSNATSSVSTGVMKVNASAWARSGIADAAGFTQLQSFLRINSADESRLGELVYVTFGAHRVDAQYSRTAAEPHDAGEFPPESSTAVTDLRYDFDLYTTESGTEHRFSWSDHAVLDEGVGTEYDRDIHEVLGELAPFRLGLVLGEVVSFNLSFTASVHAFWNAEAAIDASHSAYWGGITSVVDSAGRNVAYSVQSGDGGDWGRSYVPVAAPVPEPAAWLLGALGALGIALARRRPMG